MQFCRLAATTKNCCNLLYCTYQFITHWLALQNYFKNQPHIYWTKTIHLIDFTVRNNVIKLNQYSNMRLTILELAWTTDMCYSMYWLANFSLIGGWIDITWKPVVFTQISLKETHIEWIHSQSQKQYGDRAWKWQCM